MTIDKRTVLIAVGLIVMAIGALAYLGITTPSESTTSMQSWGASGAVAFLIGLGLVVWGVRTQTTSASKR